jgi:translation initiation factor IF-3
MVRVNHFITGTTVRVTQDGEQLGIMSLRDARQRAFDEGLDLVEIAPNANPPVCQIMDYGKFKYEKGKAGKEQQKKNKAVEMKEVQVSPVIGDHDLNTKSRPSTSSWWKAGSCRSPASSPADKSCTRTTGTRSSAK